MSRIQQRIKASLFVVVLSSVGAVFILANAPLAQGQCTGSPGEHVVYNGSNQPCLGSTAYIDASAFGTTNSSTICNIIYKIITSQFTGQPTYPAAGAVIDARGLISGTNANFMCAAGETPWLSGTNYQNYPSVLLLPAGTITSYYTWVLPDKTTIIGQTAQGSTGTGTPLGTVIAAGSGFTGPAGGYATGPAPIAMIQFGDPGAKTCGPGGSAPGICFHIAVEDLTLNGGSIASVGGILNMDSQELSYAKRINFLNFAGVGLQVGAPCNTSIYPKCEYYAQGQNSGPYEQLYYSGSGACAQIYGAGIRGIHGMTCVGTSSPAAGILLDSSSNSLEDITLSGYLDGIKIGSMSTFSPSQSDAWNDALVNISGSAGTNLIHICSSSTCVPASSPAPQDINILGATSTAGTTIQDDITNTPLSDSHVGMYALGEPQATLTTGIGYSRFTTSPNLPTWFVGTAQLGLGTTSISCPTTAQGSIYSATTGSAANGTLWTCVGGFWTFVQ